MHPVQQEVSSGSSDCGSDSLWSSLLNPPHVNALLTNYAFFRDPVYLKGAGAGVYAGMLASDPKAIW